jgi:glycosyltransferase involved in cell wall biosynthesis
MHTFNQDKTKLATEIKLPSFSIIFETENLASVELDNIYRSLASIAEQDISPKQANEFLIIDGGYAPKEIINEICSKYPWVTVHQAPGIGYYKAKMLGATLTTGDIIVYCDSDCIYVSNWLTIILNTFLQNTNINVVAGETSTPIKNIYDLAIAMHYFFPRFSKQEQPYLSSSYFLNNVAFRREFLLENPLPTNLPIYRGNCVIHTYYLCGIKQNKILQHPQAQATHEPPTPSFSFWRYLLMGRDRVLREYIKSILMENTSMNNLTHLLNKLNFTLYQKFIGVVSTLIHIRPFHIQKIAAVLREDKSRLFLLPFVIPILLWFELLVTLGCIITYIKPNLLLEIYYDFEQKNKNN